MLIHSLISQEPRDLAHLDRVRREYQPRLGMPRVPVAIIPAHRRQRQPLQRPHLPLCHLSDTVAMMTRRGAEQHLVS
jgi:hypothetical protein